MTFKMYSMLIFLLMATPIRSEWCSIIKPNGQFKRLDIYQYFGPDFNDTNSETRFLMRNKEGKEWVFNITFNDSYSLKMEKPFEEERDSNVITKFGVNGMKCIPNCNATHWSKPFINCNVYPFSGILFMGCTEYKAKDVSYHLDKNHIILKPFPSRMKPTDEEYVLYYNQSNRSEVGFVGVYEGRFSIKRCSDINGSHPYCDVLPQFISQMNETLFRQIESIVDFTSIGGKNGHLILFTIDSRPKICFTFEGQDLSPECNHSTNMATLFDECFNEPTVSPTELTNTWSTSKIKPSVSNDTPPTVSHNPRTTDTYIDTEKPSTLQSTPTTDPEIDPLLPVAIGFASLGIVLLLFIAVMVYRRFRNTSSESDDIGSTIQDKSTSKYSVTSRTDTSRTEKDVPETTVKGLSKQSVIIN